jgi:putative SOS response-associated peptidase YedK
MFDRLALNAAYREVKDVFPINRLAAPYVPRSDFEPTETVAVIVSDGSEICLDQYVWGIFPSWAKHSVNAPGETVHECPAYRRIFRKQRCVLPVTGFYGWSGQGKNRRRLRFTLGESPIFALAGLYDVWVSPGGREYRSCTLLTTPPNKVVGDFHETMPAVLSLKTVPVWLNPGTADVDLLLPLLRPYPFGDMKVEPVSPDDGKQVRRPGIPMKKLGLVKP